MKKFNTIIAIAVVALTSVFGLSSCEKEYSFYSSQTTVKPFPGYDTSATNNEQKKVKECVYKFFAGDAILSLGDFEIVVEYNGEKTIHRLSNEGTSDTQYCMVKAADGMDEKIPFNGKRITIDNMKSGSVVTPTFIPNQEAIAAASADGMIDVVAFGSVNNSTYMSSFEHGTVNMNYSKYGIQNGQVMDYINARLATAQAVIAF